MQAETQSLAAYWMDRSQSLSIGELVELSGLSEAEVREFVDAGLLAPLNPAEAAWTFSADCVVVVRRANRLRNDLELDTHATALALMLLEQIQGLEAELSRLRAQLQSPSRR
ncbi:MAG TPA: chaperone modulator CbpM [Usitatibacteraceae bacterium]